MTKMENRNFVKAAKDLRYSDRIIEMIKKAKTTEECTKIMHDARTGYIK